MITDEAVEAAAQAHDAEDAAQRGEPDPWDMEGDDFNEFRADRMSAMRAALEAALPHLLASQGCGTGHSGEQLEPAVGATASLAPELPEGFTPWHGGECPVPDETVEWINAKGHRYVFRASNVAGWDWHDPRTPSKYQWRIVGYRVVPAHPQKGGEG